MIPSIITSCEEHASFRFLYFFSSNFDEKQSKQKSKLNKSKHAMQDYENDYVVWWRFNHMRVYNEIKKTTNKREMDAKNKNNNKKKN